MSQMIQVTLLDGSHKEVAQGTTPLEIARSISPRLADAALVARIKPKQSAVSTHGTPGQAQQSATKQSGSGGSSSAGGEKTPARTPGPPAQEGLRVVDLREPP